MRVQPAAINQEGINALLDYANNPLQLGLDTEHEKQFYIPGISVPDDPVLSEPFSVPILGDEETVNLSITWLRGSKASNPCKTVEYTAALPADFYPIPGNHRKLSLGSKIFENFEDGEYPVNRSFDELLGEWAGILQATVSVGYESSVVDGTKKLKEQRTGTAQFLLIQTDHAFQRYREQMDSGRNIADYVKGTLEFKKQHGLI